MHSHQKYEEVMVIAAAILVLFCAFLVALMLTLA